MLFRDLNVTRNMENYKKLIRLPLRFATVVTNIKNKNAAFKFGIR